MQSFREARDEILTRLDVLPARRVALSKAAGRILAETITTPEPIPPFDNTSMDGFGVSSADTSAATEDETVHLHVVGAVEAGAATLPTLATGQALRIYTGAPIPPGVDAVVPWERCVDFGDDFVVLDAPVKPGACVRRAGDDLIEGAVVLEPGDRLTPAAIGLLASVGSSEPLVRPRLRVAVHSSGNELVPVTDAIGPGQIRNSNLYSMCARVEAWGAEPLPRPVLVDTQEAVRTGLRQTLALRPDAIITTGGVSAGDLDFIRDVAQELGDDVSVRRVDMKPGKPLVDGAIGGVPFFGLPGNPAACLVSFEIFVRPALAKLEGRTDGHPPEIEAVLAAPFDFRPIDRVQFLRGRATLGRTTLTRDRATSGGASLFQVELSDRQGSHQLSSFARANCFVEIPKQSSRLGAGSPVTIHLLDGAFQ